MSNIRKVTPNTQNITKILDGLKPLEPRLQLAAAMETGCPVKAERLTTYVMRQSAMRRGAAGLKRRPAHKLLADMSKYARRLKRAGVLA